MTFRCAKAYVFCPSVLWLAHIWPTCLTYDFLFEILDLLNMRVPNDMFGKREENQHQLNLYFHFFLVSPPRPPQRPQKNTFKLKLIYS